MEIATKWCDEKVGIDYSLLIGHVTKERLSKPLIGY